MRRTTPSRRSRIRKIKEERCSCWPASPSRRESSSDAQSFFERAASASSDATIRGWSQVYLGRILDIQEHRQEALEHYRAALNEAGSPELKAAAEKGLQQAYQPPAKRPTD